MRKLGPIQERILLLLSAGTALGFVLSPRKQWKIIQEVKDKWKDIDRRALREAIQKLYRSNLVSEKHHADGSITITLNESGKQQALRYSLDKMTITKPAKWDGKWRMVIFDIPESQKKLRNTFRWHIKNLGFLELQKSVFVLPYDAKRELDFIIEYYHAKQFIRYLVIESIDNDLHLRSKFSLI